MKVHQHSDEEHNCGAEQRKDRSAAAIEGGLQIYVHRIGDAKEHYSQENDKKMGEENGWCKQNGCAVKDAEPYEGPVDHRVCVIGIKVFSVNAKEGHCNGE